MADGDGVQAYNESLRAIAVYRSDLTQKVNKYNNFQIDLSGIPNFDGTGESAWHFIQTLKVIMRARNWPTGEIETDTIIGAENVYNEALANATNAQTPFGRDINAAGTTQQEKADGLAKRQPWQLLAYTQYNQTAAGGHGQGLNSSPNLAQNSFANPALDGYNIIEGTSTINANRRLATAQTSFPRAVGRFMGGAAPANGTTFAHGPINDCKRSRKLINALKTKFVGAGRDWLLIHESTPENVENFPRTLFSHRFNGQ